MSDPSSRSLAGDPGDPGRDRSLPLEGSETLQRLEEALEVTKRRVTTGTVRVSTRTETVREIAEVSLDRTVVEVTRVPVGKLVEVAPGLRTDGQTTIVPVLEERFVVVKQLFLVEELHIRPRTQSELSRTPVELKRQVAVVERIGAEKHLDTAVALGDEASAIDQPTEPGEYHGHT